MSFWRDIIGGLAHLHSFNIIHRDIAARNVLVDMDWSMKVQFFIFFIFL